MKHVETIAKQSFAHLLKNNPEVRVKDLEAEAINLISYLSLRQQGKISWKLSFLDENNIQSIINNDKNVMQGVTNTAMAMFSGNYNEGNAFVAMQGVTLNLALMAVNDHSNFLIDYFKNKHKVQLY